MLLTERSAYTGDYVSAIVCRHGKGGARPSRCRCSFDELVVAGVSRYSIEISPVHFWVALDHIDDGRDGARHRAVLRAVFWPGYAHLLAVFHGELRHLDLYRGGVRRSVDEPSRVRKPNQVVANADRVPHHAHDAT